MIVAKHWVVQGGSQAIGAATLTSDEDIFIVFDGDMPDPTIVNELRRRFRNVDIEQKDARSFISSIKSISIEELSIQKGMPETDYWTLRFATRIAMGRTLVPWPEIETALHDIHDSLRLALLAFHSTQYLNVYQDVYGLWIGCRVDEAALLCGELASRCIAVCNLHFGLCDPATKWALLQSKLLLNEQTLRSTTNLVQLVNSSFLSTDDIIARILMECNRSVASALARDYQSIPIFAGNDGEAKQLRQLSPELCISGYPAFTGAMNVVDRSCRYLTLEHLEAIAQSEPYATDHFEK